MENITKKMTEISQRLDKFAGVSSDEPQFLPPLEKVGAMWLMHSKDDGTPYYNIKFDDGTRYKAFRNKYKKDADDKKPHLIVMREATQAAVVSEQKKRDVEAFL